MIVLLTGAGLFSCADPQFEADLEDPPIIDFNYQILGDCSSPVLEVVLENNSTETKTYFWDFGDATTSAEINPIKVYNKAGTYTIKLLAYFASDTLSLEKQITIARNSDGTGPSAQISYTRTDPTKFEFAFEITTEASDYLLSFGDGTVILSTEKSIKHQYAAPGRYLVFLIAHNSEGSTCTDALLDLRP